MVGGLNKARGIVGAGREDSVGMDDYNITIEYLVIFVGLMVGWSWT